MSSPTILIVFVNAGETWLEKTDPQANLNFLPYKFTAKELDEETGLYYYGARYLDPKYSMWISTDPALGEYIPKAPIDEEAKRYNQNLPGMGGVFNHINGNLYHYAANNPLRYIDPTGRDAKSFVIGWITTDASTPDPSDASIWKWIGYGVAFLSACVIDEYKDKAIVYVASQLLENSEEPKNYVYHHTGAHNTEFAKKYVAFFVSAKLY